MWDRQFENRYVRPVICLLMSTVYVSTDHVLNGFDEILPDISVQLCYYKYQWLKCHRTQGNAIPHLQFMTDGVPHFRIP